MNPLLWLVAALMVIGAITVLCIMLLTLIVILQRPRRSRPPVMAAMVLDEMAEQRAPAAELPCRCIVYLLPGGDSYIRYCRKHSYARNPDFARWITELDSQMEK